MHRTFSILFAAAMLVVAPAANLIPAPATAAPPPLAGPEGPRTMILLATPTMDAFEAAAEAVRAEGGRVTFSYRPAMLVAFLPEEEAARLASRPEVLRVAREPVDAATLGALTRDQEAALAIWNGHFMGGRVREALVVPEGVAPPGRGYSCGVPVPAALDKKGYGAGPLSTSEYMLLDGAGSQHREFLVIVVFPESNGAIDASAENWTVADMQSALVDISAGLDWWVARYAPARMSVSLASTWAVSTPWEPIKHPHTFESVWVDDLMDTLGYGGASHYAKVRSFDNSYITGTYDAWMNTIFMVNSKNDADGRFADSVLYGGDVTKYWFDWSYFGGPFLVMTWDNGPWGNANTDYLCAHESGHTFYALDEYAASNCTDSETSGYLNVPNGNCENGGGTSVECVMRNNNRSEFTNGSVCSFSRNAIGWRDTDADSIPDILDHPPLLTLAGYAAATTCDSTPSYSATVRPELEPNVNPASYSTGSSANDSISVNRVTGVEYRVNGSAWQAATPVDGTWDEADESALFTASGLAAQTVNVIEARATNSRGLTSAIASDTLILLPGDSWADGLEDGDASDWTISNGGATISLDNTVAHSGTWSIKVLGASGASQGATATSPAIGAAPAPYIDTSEPYTVSFWFRWSDFHWDQWVICGHVRLLIDYPYLPILYDPNGNWTSLTTLGTRFDGYVPVNTWKKVEIAVTPATRQYTVTIGGTLLGTATYNVSVIPTTTLSFIENYSSTNFMNAWYDDFEVIGCASPTAVPAPDVASAPPAPAVVRLLGAAPNPFRGSSAIRYELPRAGRVTLRVYAPDGALVRTLVDAVEPEGVRAALWDGRDAAGRPVASGVYFAHLQADGRAETRKVTLAR